MGIILEAYGGYLKNVPQTYGSGRDPPPFWKISIKKPRFFFFDNFPNSVLFSVSKYLEDIVFKANAARDDAESWLSQLLDDKL